MKNTVFVLSVFLFGCSVQKIAVRQTAQLFDRGISAFYEEPDIELARQALPAHLKLLEVLYKNDPGNTTILRGLTQGFSAEAFLFLEDSDPARAAKFYERARDYGLEALAFKTSSDWQKADGPEISALLEKISVADSELLFWTAFAWGGLINLDKTPAHIFELPKVKAMMQRVRALNPSCFYGGADLFLGSLYGGLPTLLGGSPEKAKQHFDAALEFSRDKMLVVQLYTARFYAVPKQDAELYKKLLQAVIDFNVASYPQMRLVNTVAQQRAKKMLEDSHVYFQ